MKPTIEYATAVKRINDEIVDMLDQMESKPVKVLAEIGAAVAKNVEAVAPVSEQEYYYSFGQKKPNVHIKDDVVFKVKYSRKARSNYVSVSGGRKTWKKWHLADEGHVAQNGRFIPGNGFVQKAVLMSEPIVDSIVDGMIGEIIK